MQGHTLLLANALLVASATFVVAEDPLPAPEATGEGTVTEAAEDDGAVEAAEAAYRTRAEAWNAAWLARPKPLTRDQVNCLGAYAEGEKIRDEMRATTPPERFAEYHDSLLVYADASLAVEDECLLKPGAGPKWRAKRRTAASSRNAIHAQNVAGKLGLPIRW